MMSLTTLPAYLLGNRAAILELASSRWTLLIGGLFVLSAGLAREYDGADLLHEPWHLLIAFGSSLVACGLLFLITFLIPLRHAELPDRLIWSRFWSFLGLFWMTAPLAWVYAIPFERYMDEASAITANFVCLGMVSLWRVALMTRVIAVLTGCSAGAALGRVLLFGSLVAFLLSIASSAPFFLYAMAGTRFPPAEETRMAVSSVACYGSVPGLIVFAIAVNVSSLPATTTWPWLSGALSASSALRGKISLLALASASVVVWLLPMLYTQGEQQQASTVDRLWKEQRRGEALDYLSAREPWDFPPHWQPPPRWTLHFKWVQQETMLTELDEALHTRCADWLRDRHIAQLGDLIGTVFSEHGYHNLKPEAIDQLAILLEGLPEGPELARRFQERLELAAKEVERDRERGRGKESAGPAGPPHAVERVLALAKKR